MNENILFVDDEINVLNAYKRGLRRQFMIDTATSGDQALQLLQTAGPYAVVISDMRMPGMDGITLLAEFKRQAPQTVRIMLTGNADQQTAIDAINTGDIFRFLTKPCSPEDLGRALRAGLEQHHLIIAEQELLEKTVTGSIRALTDVLSLINPEAFGRTTRLKKYMSKIGMQVGLEKQIWWLETLASLSQIGCVILPQGVLQKVASGQVLSEEEFQLFEMQPCVGADLVAEIPRMDRFADSIRYQQKNYDGTGMPHDDVCGRAIPAGARILKVVLDFDSYESSGLSPKKALLKLSQHKQWYDPKILVALERVIGAEIPEEIRAVRLKELNDGMVFAEDIRTPTGILIVCKGHTVTTSVRHRLKNFAENGHLTEPLRVSIPPVDTLSAA
jgi:response regulator RpfG family c-di-GMP phosphodiesterase